jgi:hypothetical protein
MKPRIKEPTNQIIFTVYVMIKEKFSILIHNHMLDYRDRFKLNIYPTWGEHDDHYTIDAIKTKKPNWVLIYQFNHATCVPIVKNTFLIRFCLL